MNEQNRALLEKYRSLILPVKDQDVEVKTAQSFLQGMPDDEVRAAIVMDQFAGNFFAVPCPLRPSLVYECVTGSIGKDSVVCVYNGSPIFNSAGELIKARTELIEAIQSTFVKESDHKMVVDDRNRSRFVLLKEMATAQLWDTLEQVVNLPQPPAINVT